MIKQLMVFVWDPTSHQHTDSGSKGSKGKWIDCCFVSSYAHASCCRDPSLTCHDRNLVQNLSRTKKERIFTTEIIKFITTRRERKWKAYFPACVHRWVKNYSASENWDLSKTWDRRVKTPSENRPRDRFLEIFFARLSIFHIFTRCVIGVTNSSAKWYELWTKRKFFVMNSRDTTFFSVGWRKKHERKSSNLKITGIHVESLSLQFSCFLGWKTASFFLFFRRLNRSSRQSDWDKETLRGRRKNNASNLAKQIAVEANV